MVTKIVAMVKRITRMATRIVATVSRITSLE